MNTRIAVRVSKEAYDAISFLSEISGTPRGRILGDVCEAAVPSLITVADAYRAALALEGRERAALLEGMKEAEEVLLATAQAVDERIKTRLETRSSPSPEPVGSEGGERQSDPPILTGGFTTSVYGGQNGN